MRRVAAYIYKKAGRWKQSIALSKKDSLYKDAMETCSQSGERELSEELLVYFIEQVRFLPPLLLYYYFIIIHCSRINRVKDICTLLSESYMFFPYYAYFLDYYFFRF